MSKIVVVVLLMTVFNMAALTLFDYAHEQAHFEIGRHHGCVEGHIHMMVFERSYYQCETYGERTVTTMENEQALHGINEIVGYQLFLVFWALLMLGNLKLAQMVGDRLV